MIGEIVDANRTQQGRGAQPHTGRTDERRPMSDHPPLFLHCGWRSRGTWIWHQFRVLQGVAAYYEPLSEGLATLRPRTLDAWRADIWDSGHEFLDRPYFEEFRQFLAHEQPGVRGYCETFATLDFFASADAALPRLKHYLRLLLGAAHARDEQPVLKFSRSLGRIGWMLRNFPDAAHVVVLRNPLSQFESARRQLVLHGNAYFLAVPLMLLATHQELPAVHACAQQLDVELPLLAGHPKSEARLALCKETLLRGGPAASYRSFLAFWLLTASAIPIKVDLIIDSDRLVHSSRYRQDSEQALAALTGRPVAFPAGRGEEFYANSDYRPLRSEILTAHRLADAFLIERAGVAWCDEPALGQVGGMLAEAGLRALTDGAALAADRNRAMQAEAELAAMLASRSWKLTAPLRWARAQLALLLARQGQGALPPEPPAKAKPWQSVSQAGLPHHASIR
jgi:hypothetical protein